MPRSTFSATTGPASGRVGHVLDSKTVLAHPLKNIARAAMGASGNTRLISLRPRLDRQASAERMISPRMNEKEGAPL